MSAKSGLKMRIGILTGGGDAPGLNSVIESVARVLASHRIELVGICDGFEGIFDLKTKHLDPQNMIGVHSQPGTLLGTSNKSGLKGREEEFLKNYHSLNLDGLIAIGGDGTFAGLSNVKSTVKIIGVPKTIDNDLAGTDITFGYDTACASVAESVDALRFTADAHRRIFFVETMGRTAGWIALGGGLASYADAILIPERPFDRARLIEYLGNKKSLGHRGLIVVVAEGAVEKNGVTSVAFRVESSPEPERLGGFAEKMARTMEREVDWDCRHVVLGHLQRSRAPSTTDRFLTAAMGVETARMVIEGKWGEAVVYRNGLVQRAPIEDLMKPPKRVGPNHRWVQLAQAMGIFI